MLFCIDFDVFGDLDKRPKVCIQSEFSPGATQEDSTHGSTPAPRLAPRLLHAWPEAVHCHPKSDS